ncbi:MAG: hypothetical protein ABIC82_06190 [bacterium]
MINNEKFDQEILGKIKEKKSGQKSKWHFLLKNYVIWAVGVLALIIGGLAFSVIIYLLKYNDWSAYKQINRSFFEFILLTLPYFWVLFLALFVLIVNYDIKRTKKGYRYPLPILVAASITISILLGGIFFRFGLGEVIDDVLGERAPFYEKIFNRQADFWSHPEEGRLAGFVLSKNSDTEFVILDIKQNEWKVQLEQNENFPSVEIKIGHPIRVAGSKLEENIFSAEMIMPAVPPGRRFFMRHKNKHFPMFTEPQVKVRDFQDEIRFREKF